jgi:hypothetical protein
VGASHEASRTVAAVSVRHSDYTRAELDFYVEPAWTVHPLLERLPISVLHDPCCGVGTIVTTAVQRGLVATGSDIVDRAGGLFPVKDFLADNSVYANVVTNPPFRHAARIIDHALGHVIDGGRVAVLVPITFLASKRRHALFCRPETESVLILSRRPSMPPGATLEAFGEAIRGNGSVDFC